MAILKKKKSLKRLEKYSLYRHLEAHARIERLSLRMRTTNFSVLGKILFYSPGTFESRSCFKNDFRKPQNFIDEKKILCFCPVMEIVCLIRYPWDW